MQHWQLGTIFLHSQIKAKWETSSCFRQNRNRSRKFRFQKTIPLSWSRIQKHTEMQQTHFCSHLQLPHWGRQAHGTSQTQILTEKHIIYLGLFRVLKTFTSPQSRADTVWPANATRAHSAEQSSPTKTTKMPVIPKGWGLLRTENYNSCNNFKMWSILRQKSQLFQQSEVEGQMPCNGKS